MRMRGGNPVNNVDPTGHYYNNAGRWVTEYSFIFGNGAIYEGVTGFSRDSKNSSNVVFNTKDGKSTVVTSGTFKSGYIKYSITENGSFGRRDNHTDFSNFKADAKFFASEDKVMAKKDQIKLEELLIQKHLLATVRSSKNTSGRTESMIDEEILQLKLSNLVLTDAMKKVGIKIVKINGKRYYDYSVPINKMLVKNAKECKSHRANSAANLASLYSSTMWFMNQVKSNSVWDLKIKYIWEDALPNVPYIGFGDGNFGKFAFNGKIITAEDLGNITYGYWGRAMGFGPQFIYWGAGFAALHGSKITFSNLVDKRLMKGPNYGDSPNDTPNITYGINLYNSANKNDIKYIIEGNPTKEYYDTVQGPTWNIFNEGLE